MIRIRLSSQLALWVLLSSAYTTTSQLARAEPAPETSSSIDAALLRAVRAKEQALEAPSFAAWEQTLEAFALADPDSKSADLQYERAFAAEQLDRVVVAIDGYERALALGLMAPASDHARRYLEANRKRVGRLVFGDAPLRKVYVDGELERPGAHGLITAPGSHTVVWETADGRQGGGAYSVAAAAEVHVDTRPSIPNQRNAHEPVLPAQPPESAAGPGRPSPTSPPQRGNAGWPLLWSGAGLTALGLAGGFYGVARVQTERRELPQYCTVLDGPDGCLHVTPGGEREAQATVDAIATWKTVRAVGWVSAGVGSALVGWGLFLLLDTDDPGQTSGSMPHLSTNVAADGATVSVGGVF